MAGGRVEAVVAGHICLDIIPELGAGRSGAEELLRPGKLVEIGAAVTSTGGAVANTGISLHRLGVPVRLVGKLGDDLFGRALLDALRACGPALAEGTSVTAGETTSYTLVVSPPGVDRTFWHCPGGNNTFSSADVPEESLAGARLFHFGYPPLMKRMYSDGGAELAELLARVRGKGLTVSLDMAMPDPGAASGRVDWPALLARALPQVDVFLPSLDETLFMLDRARFASGDVRADGALLGELSARLVEMGAAVVGLKLGDQGLYLRTTSDPARLVAMGACAPGDAQAWTGRELLAPCFEVKVAGTTGSGDATVAGFLAALLKGLSPEEAITCAVAAGACNVERPDATGGIPSWAALNQRVSAGWKRRPVEISLPGWKPNAGKSLWRGPDDAGQSRGEGSP